MTKDEALRLALSCTYTDSEIKAMRTVLAQPELDEIIREAIWDSSEIVAPPKKEWQGLTDEERIEVLHSGDKEGYLEYAKGIEAKLKEKNCG